MKKIILFFISFLLLLNHTYALDLDINSKYAYVYNLTEDKIMYEKDAYEEIKVASMTKIMTAIIVIENNEDLDKEIIIKDEDLRDMYEYTTTGFQAGDKVTIKELLYGILLKSGSDAVNAAVRVTTTTEEEFIDLMNQKVKELNLTHTYFSNPVGKDEDNYSSVYDIGKIMEYCLKNEDFKDIISTDMHYVESLDLQINGPLYKMNIKYDIDTSIIKGGKSGFTTLAKHSLVSYGEKDGVSLIIVTDYADNYKSLLQDNVNLYNYFFDSYSYNDYNINFNIDIENGKEDTYNVNIDTKIYLENNYDQNLITYKYNGKNKINFLIKKGDKLGEVSVYYDKELIKTVDVKLKSNIEYKPKAYFKISFIFVAIAIILIFLGIIKIKSVKKKNKQKKIIPKKNIEVKSSKIKTINTTHQNKVKREITPEIENFIKEENSKEKKLNILKNTININLFFDNLKSIELTQNEKELLQHDFIDRCFESIDFKNFDDLNELYTKLKLYKKEMSINTIKYYNTLFKYCIDEYIDKK